MTAATAARPGRRWPRLIAGVALLAAVLAVPLAPSAHAIVATVPRESARLSGTPADATARTAGGYVALTPTRVVDTRTGTHGNRRGALGPRRTFTAQISDAGDRVPSSGVAAVAVTVTLLAPTASGAVVAYRPGHHRPAVSTVQFTRGRAATDGAVVALFVTGRLALTNSSAGSVQLVVNVTGYYRSGTIAAAGALSPVAPQRVVDTRTGLDGNRDGALPVRHAVAVRIGGHAGVAVGAAAVAATITVYDPSRTGALTAWPTGRSRPAAPQVRFTAGQSVSALVVVPLSAAGSLDLYDGSSRAVQVSVDVSGYLLAGAPTAAQTVSPLTPDRVLDTARGTDGNHRGAVPGHAGIAVRLGGHGGVPQAHVSAVLATVTVLPGAASGGITAWRGGTRRPGGTSLQFQAGQTASATLLVPVSTGGAADLYNDSARPVRLVLDVRGYVSSARIVSPRVSLSSYIRSPDTTTWHSAGASAAEADSTLVVIDIGAQANSGTGVVLSGTSQALTYAQLVDRITDYLSGFAGERPDSRATIALGTNNDGTDWTHYTSRQRGRDWATKVVDAVSAARPADAQHLVITGADDIESSFFSTQAQAQVWESSYLAATSHALIYNGSADGCPTTFDETGATCAFGWTQRQYYALAHHGTRIRVAPQVYTAGQAIQWAGIDATGGGGLIVAGSLTERSAAPTRSVVPSVGWVNLYRALSSVVRAPAVPAATDLGLPQ